jgi:hypothetical protein
MPALHCLPLLILLALLVHDTAHGASRKIFNLCRVIHPGDADIAWDCLTLKRSAAAEKLFGERWQDVLRFNRVDRRHLYPGVSLKVPRDLAEVADYTPLPAEYPDAAEEAKFILVDLAEQFLGAYEYGELVFSFPIASGDRVNRTPTGDFRVNAYHRRHKSSLYKIEKKDISYPMHYGLRFFTNRRGVDFWIHGRDVPGYPQSHGCIGLYDEEMQKRYYHYPPQPILQDARTLYEWSIAPRPDSGALTVMNEGPRVRIVGESFL